jgi:hypothetical protein
MMGWSGTACGRVTALTAMVWLAGCGESPPPMADGGAQTAEVPVELARMEATARELPVIEGETRDGNVQTSFRAYTDGDSVRFVEEVVTGEYAATRDRYYFRDGRLAYFHREGSQLVAMPPEPPGLGDVVMFVAFDDTGRPTEQLKRLKGQPAGIESFELTAISSRAKQITDEVRRQRRTTLDEGEMEGYLVMGEPLTTFQPCGDPRIYWLDGEPAVMSRLRADYDRVATRPLEPLYARVRGQFAERIPTGMASNYPAVLRLDAFSSIDRRQDRDCP